MKQIFAIAAIAMSLSSIAEASIYKCTLTANYNRANPQVTTGLIDANDENGRIELNARNAQVQPYAMITAFDGKVLVNIVAASVESYTVNKKTFQYVGTKTLTGSNAGFIGATSVTDASGVTHSVSCTAVK